MQLNQENLLYEYAVLRFVPKVERGEFINIGLIMMCKRRKWIECKYEVPINKCKMFATGIDIALLRSHLDAMLDIVTGEVSNGQLAALPVEERFRWLTAVKSGCIQVSEVHPGITKNLEMTFINLFKELVL